MKVALVFGSKGKIVKPRLQEVKDNLDIEMISKYTELTKEEMNNLKSQKV